MGRWTEHLMRRRQRGWMVHGEHDRDNWWELTPRGAHFIQLALQYQRFRRQVYRLALRETKRIRQIVAKVAKAHQVLSIVSDHWTAKAAPASNPDSRAAQWASRLRHLGAAVGSWFMDLSPSIPDTTISIRGKSPLLIALAAALVSVLCVSWILLRKFCEWVWCRPVKEKASPQKPKKSKLRGRPTERQLEESTYRLETGQCITVYGYGVGSK